MKMVRSLLLGTAAGFVALTGAQAADLPVKAKPVQYVKICDLYGAGYFYVPGTDTCMKIGGYVRFNAGLDSNAGAQGFFGGIPFGAAAPAFAQNSLYNRRDTQDINYRARIWMTGDVRSQTSMGTLRSYYAVQIQNVGPGDNASTASISLIRGFIQLAGFTVGRSTSLADLPDANSALTNIGYSGFGGTTAPTGINMIAYTAQFGNGLSASIGLESPDQRRRAVVNLSRGGFGAFNIQVNSAQSSGATVATGGSAGGNVPDITANIDVTQAWGSARIAGALHQVTGDYYTGSNAALGYTASLTCVAGTPVTCGSPGDTFGYAIAAGFTITQIPGLPGDLFGVSAGYSRGASAYTSGLSANNSNINIYKGSVATTGVTTDGVFVNGSGIELTDVWYVSAAFQHAWAPNLKTSIFGGYANVSYNSTVRNWLCTTGAGGGGTPTAPAATGITAFTGTCNPDFSYWQIGSRLFNWTPVPNLDIGLDVVYWNFNTGFAGTGTVAGNSALPTTVRTIGNAEVWTANLQITRSFWP